MYAVVDIAGRQYKVSEKDKIMIPTLDQKAGSTVKFDKVLLIQREKELAIGNPLVAGAGVEATVLGHDKDDKVIVFKKKKRKGYRLKRGHRQGFTEIEITKVG